MTTKREAMVNYEVIKDISEGENTEKVSRTMLCQIDNRYT